MRMQIKIPILIMLLLALPAAAQLAPVASMPQASAGSFAAPAAIDGAKQNASLTLQYGYVGDYPIPMNATISLNGRLTPEINGTGTLYWSIEYAGFVNQQDITFVNGRSETPFNFTAPGGWGFKVVFHGDDTYNSAESSVVYMAVAGEKQNATLTMAVSPSSAAAGSNVTLSGSLSPLQTGSVTIYRSVNGSTASQVGTAPLVAGQYSHNTTLTYPGAFSYYAVWSGSGAYKATISNSVAVTSQAVEQPAQPAWDSTWLIIAGVAVAAVVIAALYFLMKRKK